MLKISTPPEKFPTPPEKMSPLPEKNLNTTDKISTPLKFLNHTAPKKFLNPPPPLQKRGLLFLTKRLPRKRNQNWRTFDYFQKVIVCESQ